ncbi:N5-glutamine methyltransferase family protein [Brachybacterium tyrofermentans]|uniref:N5-glutamine methyltransferase family protein n=1 Tax=Brachybacterium tyrofermentans TaxID=47848 RepID=UPI003FCF4142
MMTMMPPDPAADQQIPAPDPQVRVLVERLRRAGCVFAEQEARILLEASAGVELERLCARREAGEALEHLVGRVEIGGELLAVGPACFVPRQRTLALIEAAVQEARSRRSPVMVEAYCGVAPIAALVARRVPGVNVHATDRDELPLVHARTNLPAGAGVHRGSGLDGLPTQLAGTVDLIAAVPPYVPSAQLELMPRDARGQEPEAALVAGDDGLDEVRVLLREAPRWLAPGGVLLLEMHRDQVPCVLAEARRQESFDVVGHQISGDGETAVVHVRREAGLQRAAVPEGTTALHQVERATGIEPA